MRVDLLITADILDLANRAAHVFDYDSGGANTFGNWPLTEDGTTISHYFARTLLSDEYIPAFETPQGMYDALSVLAAERDREPLTLQECETLHTGMTMAPEIDYEALGLTRFKSEI